MIQEFKDMYYELPGLRSEKFTALVIGLIGVILRTWRLTRSPLWYDEAFSAILASLPIKDMITATAGDVHPPLYYLVIHGTSGPALRVYSVIFSILAMYVFWLILFQLDVKPGARLVALALMALSAPQLWYAAEARMYAMLELIILLLWYLVNKRSWVLVGVVATLALYTHGYAVFYILILAMAAVYKELYRPKNFYVPPASGGQPDGYANTTHCVMAFGIAGLCFMPWFVAVQLSQMGSITHHWTQAVNPLGQLVGLTTILFGRNLPDGLLVVAVIVISAGVPLLISWAVKHQRWVVAAMLFGPVAMVVAVSVAWHPIWLIRGLLPSMPALYILLAEVIASAQLQHKLIIIGVLLPLWGAGIITHIGTTSVGIAKYDPQAYRTSVNVDPAVPVIHLTDFSLVTWKATRPELTHYLYVSGCQDEPGSLAPSTRAAMGVQLLEDLPERYTLAAAVGALSNACLENEFNLLTGQSTPLLVDPYDYGVSGVWAHGQ